MNHLKFWVMMAATCVVAVGQTQTRANLAGANMLPGAMAKLFASPLAAAMMQSDTTPGSTVYALPQLAFGGSEWYTALYISNPTDAAATFSVKFVGDDGLPLSVPLIGTGPISEQTVNLAPKATVIMEAPNSGILRQGWTEATLPSGLIGYGVFRQSKAGQADQEAVVPLSITTSQTADMTWDENGFTTAVALVNPGATPASITITAFDSNGTQIGSTTKNLGPRSKTAFTLNQPDMDITAKRGFARFSVTSGAVSVLGLRFGGSAFTSIPVTYK